MRAAVDVPARFRKSKSVGAVFGLTCAKYQSGEVDWSGRISGCGDEMMRVMLPTVHGFDEWLGNLYHLNAEEEPENVDYPKDPAFKAKFGPRGVMHCFATDKDDATDDRASARSASKSAKTPAH